MNETQYRAALRAVDAFMPDDPELGTPMGVALDALARLCVEYERVHFPFCAATPEALAEFRRLERRL
jgi:antitoxin component HigA of HigAB toxin-antitoxin module